MVTLNVNGTTHELDVEPDTPLLYVLRDNLGLNGAKFGCGLGQCGACTVVVDGSAVLSCVVPAMLVTNRAVTTVEDWVLRRTRVRCRGPSWRSRQPNAATALPA